MELNKEDIKKLEKDLIIEIWEKQLLEFLIDNNIKVKEEFGQIIATDREAKILYKKEV